MKKTCGDEEKTGQEHEEPKFESGQIDVEDGSVRGSWRRGKLVVVGSHNKWVDRFLTLFRGINTENRQISPIVSKTKNSRLEKGPR